MELKLLNENRLKITLTNEDMALMDITYEEMDYDEDINTKRVVWEILDKAKRQTGFDASGPDDLYINVRPDKNGGCFIYVTKDSKIPKSSFFTYPYIYEKKYKSKIFTGIKKKRLLYVFESSEILLDVCIQLNALGYNGKSDIFADTGKYYLYYLYIEDKDNIEPNLDFISEYGVLINNPFFIFYLDEHAKKIFSSCAVKEFAEIFK